jgi:hypothetical protein
MKRYLGVPAAPAIFLWLHFSVASSSNPCRFSESGLRRKQRYRGFSEWYVWLLRARPLPRAFSRGLLHVFASPWYRYWTGA